MDNTGIFEELTDEELNKYVDDHFAGTDEFKEQERKKRKEGILKSIKKNTKDLSSLSEVYKGIPRNNPELLAASAGQMLSISKTLWDKCYQLRASVPAGRTGGRYGDDLEGIFKSSEIKAEKLENGYIHIVLPSLIPHKKMKESIPRYADNYRMPLYNALSRVFPTVKPVFSCRAAVLITHIFDGDSLVDYDNFDYVHLLNCIADFFLVDDSPLYYSLHINAKQGDFPHTEVHLMPEKDFYSICLKYPEMFFNPVFGN